MYTRSLETIYLSLRAQVAVGTSFMKSPVEGNRPKWIYVFCKIIINVHIFLFQNILHLFLFKKISILVADRVLTPPPLRPCPQLLCFDAFPYDNNILPSILLLLIFDIFFLCFCLNCLNLACCTTLRAGCAGRQKS